MLCHYIENSVVQIVYNLGQKILQSIRSSVVITFVSIPNVLMFGRIDFCDAAWKLTITKSKNFNVPAHLSIYNIIVSNKSSLAIFDTNSYLSCAKSCRCCIKLISVVLGENCGLYVVIIR